MLYYSGFEDNFSMNKNLIILEHPLFKKGGGGIMNDFKKEN